jgi:hypothetical protein
MTSCVVGIEPATAIAIMVVFKIWPAIAWGVTRAIIFN